MLPVPNSPNAFNPQHFSPPEVVTAHECVSPTEIETTPDNSTPVDDFTSTGDVCWTMLLSPN
jgi:hypothetical protein